EKIRASDRIEQFEYDRQPSQAGSLRVRDRLVGLLSASGLRVGLPSAVSVVFSQSELGSTATSTERICTSSQEVASTTSLPDPSASITDSFPRVFKEFDFLEAEHDSVSETADSCFGWLSTMRPRSIGGDEPTHDDDVDVDEDEVIHQSFRPGDRLNGVDEESIDSSSFCCRSRTSIGEFYSPKTTPTYPIYIQCPHHLDGKVDSTWISIVSELQDDTEGEMTAYATLLFTQLFRSCCGRVASLLRDAMHIFSSRPLARTFAHAQDVLTGVTDSPFLFVTAQYLRCSGILPRLKLSLFELREHWETFNERKEQNIRVSSFWPTKVPQGTFVVDRRCLLLFLVIPKKTVAVKSAQTCASFQAYTLSPAILDHQRELLVCTAELPALEMQSSLRPEHSGDSLVLLMTNKRYGQALLTLRQLRRRASKMQNRSSIDN
ncbi:unnamed protein product, partial [Nippostrongylus brasiliensis]|uniref:Rab3 GTPase-activating protein catalytic subunit n=1 Tax=Nippostrongylus brasiliensis TaxID=27835 RepID=A0A0N4XCV5_NIPBR